MYALVTGFISTRKVVIKTFSSILYISHCSFDYTFLQRGMNMMFVLGVYKPGDTMFHRQLTEDTFRESLLYLIGTFLLLACFSLDIYKKREFACLLVLSQSITKYILTLLYLKFNQL
jgi:hypothetical protein